MALPARLLRRAFSSAPGGRRRRRAWEASLSPLERLKQLLPPEEAAAVQRYVEPRSPTSQQAPPEEKMAAAALSAAPTAAPSPEGPPEKKMAAAAAAARPGPLRAGELALAELRRKHNSTLKLMCRLEAGAVLNSHGGLLPHRDIIGQLPGQLLRSSAGARLLLRRPSLDEYVLLMPRGPTIAYPKDISAMLMMMDIHPGDVVLESGTGSGALTLFLSRAVGPKGRVISYEIRDDHHSLAKKNYRHWRATWKTGHTEEWPDNVDFILKDISTAAEDMKSVTFDAIVLDMLNPQSALSVVHPSLKEGGVCTVYLANITQVIDLLDRIRTCNLPFACEKIVEVTHRNWLVLPAKIKNCKSSQRVETQENIEEDPQQRECDEIQTQDQIVLQEGECNESFPDDAETYCSAPYVARPSRWQDAHSAFLTKLRKFRPPLS
ncbi:tRNA (adenine(58)-N(1))-methyltransferase, mitochondrial isoform X2 [Numida meleagris]|uniref:tRNA (adenine(58)-N(1))-methyltransferase, mitochondrial isoform X2 n=1 Tax=Numida meleagris TaxID=8996 RepID=UPI000B3DEC21|nr:tRNA (adenine(58)-N(1))-methyltransferase, mitochondrial isoform X2 [Numida meleagris]